MTERAPGMAVQALAGEIVEALLADEKDGGYDLTAGMFGQRFSDLVRRWANLEYAAPSKSSFADFVDEQEGNGPDAPSVGGKEGAWVDLTDEDRDRAFNTLPDMLDGFMKKWGWLHFAKAIEAICREKNGAPQEGAEG